MDNIRRRYQKAMKITREMRKTYKLKTDNKGQKRDEESTQERRYTLKTSNGLYRSDSI